MIGGMRLDFEVFGEKEISREILNLGLRADHAQPAFMSIAADMREDLARQFDSQGAEASGGWQPLKPETLRRKRAEGQDPRILHATLALRNALTEENSNWIVTDDSLTFTPDEEVWYGEVHQKGSTAANIPRRPPVAFSEIAKRGYMTKLQRYLVEGVLPI